LVNRNNLPREFAVERGNRHKYFQDLVNLKTSPFYKQTMKDVFMYAMVIGFTKKKRLELKSRQPVIPTRVFSDDDLSIIKSIGIAHTKKMDVLYDGNEKELVKIAEEFANGGIDILYYQVFGDITMDPDRNLEQELRDFINKNVELAESESSEPVNQNVSLMMEFENTLRQFLMATLNEHYGSEWWKKAVPKDVQENCLQRKEKQEKMPWMSKTEYPLIYYADFQDYIKIILRRDNWKNIYSKYFLDEAWIKTKLVHELSPIRNSIAHNRGLSVREIQKLELATNEILNCLNG